jgi:hypothetical protein
MQPSPAPQQASPAAAAAAARLGNPDERWLHPIIVSRSLGDRP